MAIFDNRTFSGGALATLCSADLIMNKIVNANRIALITLGSPRAVNYFFAKWIDSQKLWMNSRVEFNRDFFTSVPAQNNGAYWHHGRLIQLSIQNGVHKREVATTVGEENGMARKIGNLSSSVLSIGDLIIPFFSRFATSAIGGLGDFVTGASISDHGKYWDFEPYHDYYHDYDD